MKGISYSFCADFAIVDDSAENIQTDLIIRGLDQEIAEIAGTVLPSNTPTKRNLKTSQQDLTQTPPATAVVPKIDIAVGSRTARKKESESAAVESEPVVTASSGSSGPRNSTYRTGYSALSAMQRETVAGTSAESSPRKLSAYNTPREAPSFASTPGRGTPGRPPLSARSGGNIQWMNPTPPHAADRTGRREER